MPGCTVQFPPPPTDTYTDLSLIEGQGLPQGELAFPERVRLKVEGKDSEILEQSNKIELKDLFKFDRKERKVILIEGPPAYGKTTLARHICQEWALGKLFSEFELVVYVQLHNPKVQKAESIAGLLPRKSKKDQQPEKVIAEFEAKDVEGVLFVLDMAGISSRGFCTGFSASTAHWA